MDCGQGSETGVVADTCLTAAGSLEKKNTDTPTLLRSQEVIMQTTSEMLPSPHSYASDTTSEQQRLTKIHRSESYRHIIEAAEEEEEDEDQNEFFFNRFKPTAKFVNIEKVQRSKSVKM